MSTQRHAPLIIIGSGPAGYTAALYAARANLNPLLITGMHMGGQLTTTTHIDNWPGGKEVNIGPEFKVNIQALADRFSTYMVCNPITHFVLSINHISSHIH